MHALMSALTNENTYTYNWTSRTTILYIKLELTRQKLLPASEVWLGSLLKVDVMIEGQRHLRRSELSMAFAGSSNHDNCIPICPVANGGGIASVIITADGTFFTG